MAADSDLATLGTVGTEANLTVAAGALAFTSVSNAFPSTVKTIVLDFGAATSATWAGLEKLLSSTGSIGLDGTSGVTLSIILPTAGSITGFDAALDNAGITFSTVVSLSITSAAANDVTYPILASKLASTPVTLTALSLALTGLNDTTNALFLAIKGNSNITTVTWTSGDIGSCAVATINTSGTWTSNATSALCLTVNNTTTLKNGAVIATTAMTMDCEASPNTFTALDVTTPTSSNYDNIDTTDGVTFGGSWSLTDAAGNSITSPAVPINGGTISWTSTELGNLTTGTSYLLTFTPAYTGNGAVKSFSTNADERDLVLEINYCNNITTKKSSAEIEFNITNGNLTTDCASITEIEIIAPTASDYINVDMTVGVSFGGVWELLEGTTSKTSTILAGANGGNISITTPDNLAATFEVDKLYTLKWKPSYTGGTPEKTVDMATEYVSYDISFCKKAVVPPPATENSNVLTVSIAFLLVLALLF